MTFAPRLKRGAVLADVTSANIVGYQTIAAPAANHYISLSVQFTSLDGIPKTVSNLFTYASGSPKARPGFGTQADNLWLWDPSLNNGAGSWAKFWYKSAAGTLPAGWYKQGVATVPASDPVPDGSTVLFFRGTYTGVADAATLQLAGGVHPLNGKVQQTDLQCNKYRFICYPWPVEFNINKLAACQANPKARPGFGTQADNVWIWDPTLNNGAGSWAKFWYRTGGSTWSAGWYKQGDTTKLADFPIPAGEGFLFFRGTYGEQIPETITFKGPEYVEPAQ